MVARSDLTRSPDKSVSFIGSMRGSMDHNGTSDDASYPIEWEDKMPAMNRTSTPATMGWAIIDDHTGERKHGNRLELPGRRPGQAAPHELDDRRSLDAASLPRVRPAIPGTRPYGAQNDNLVWKDTVLVPAGDTVDILIEATNPGRWMAHCHIAEHLEGGMMLNRRLSDNAAVVASFATLGGSAGSFECSTHYEAGRLCLNVIRADRRRNPSMVRIRVVVVVGCTLLASYALGSAPKRGIFGAGILFG